MYSTSVLMVSVDISNRGGKGIPVLKMSEEEGELCPLHAEAAPIELVVNGGKGIGDAVELTGELGVFVLEVVVPIYLSNCSWIVEAAGLFNEGVETSIMAGEDGKEPWSCCLSNGGLSIVRLEEKLCDVVGSLGSCLANSSTCPFLIDPIHSRTTIRPPPVGTAVVTRPSLHSKPLGMLRRPSRACSCQLSCAHCWLIRLSRSIFCSALVIF